MFGFLLFSHLEFLLECLHFDQMAVTFEDVTVIFTWDEWKFLDSSQRKLYKELMWENYTHVMIIGKVIPDTEDKIDFI